MLAGLMAGRILHAGAKLPEFKVELITLVAAIWLVCSGRYWSSVHNSKPRSEKVSASTAYSPSATCARTDNKWLRGGAAPGEPLVGSADVQSLADLRNSFEVLREMRTWD